MDESHQESVVTFCLAGDVMTGRGIDQILPFSNDPELYEPHSHSARDYLQLARKKSGKIPDKVSFSYPWGDTLNLLTSLKPEVRIINLETSITTSSNYWKQKSIHYRMHPRNIPLLTEAGIDVCVLCNNHILDWGREGLKETLELLESKGIKIAGAGMNNRESATPAIINTKSGRVLVFGYGTPDSGIPKTWKASKSNAGINLLESFDQQEMDRIKVDIEKHRRTGDCIVISLHWGSNWGYEIPDEQRRLAHYLLDSGVADIIHGHSSHHPKAIEVYNNRLILYGCGDLLNDYEGISGYEQYRDDLSLLYFPTLNRKGELQSLKMKLFKIQQFQLLEARTGDIRWMVDRLNKECQNFETSLQISAENDLLELMWQPVNVGD